MKGNIKYLFLLRMDSEVKEIVFVCEYICYIYIAFLEKIRYLLCLR